jgi:hypothetical protein
MNRVRNRGAASVWIVTGVGTLAVACALGALVLAGAFPSSFSAHGTAATRATTTTSTSTTTHDHHEHDHNDRAPDNDHAPTHTRGIRVRASRSDLRADTDH